MSQTVNKTSSIDAQFQACLCPMIFMLTRQQMRPERCFSKGSIHIGGECVSGLPVTTNHYGAPSLEKDPCGMWSKAPRTCTVGDHSIAGVCPHERSAKESKKERCSRDLAKASWRHACSLTYVQAPLPGTVDREVFTCIA